MDNQASDLRGTIVHFTSEMLDNPNDYGIYPTTNFYNDLEEAILDWHNEQIEAVLDRIEARKEQTIYADFESGSVEGWTGVPVSAIEAERNLKTGKKILPGQKERN